MIATVPFNKNNFVRCSDTAFSVSIVARGYADPDITKGEFAIDFETLNMVIKFYDTDIQSDVYFGFAKGNNFCMTYYFQKPFNGYAICVGM